MNFQDMSFDQRYRAVQSRDHRFDGQFVLGVTTTGIYCRPSCPARTPKPENVQFFRASAAAHAAGFRACKRCLPEAVPGSPEWNLRGDVAGRAMRLINDGVIDLHGVSGLAQRLGYSTRHLTRILRDETGAGPLALARAHRAQTARVLLTQTAMPISDIAFSAGFSSIRQFNDTIREVYDLSPQQVRAHGRRTAQTDTPIVDIGLSYREPIDLPGLFDWFAARAIPGLEHADAWSYARAVHLSGGPAWFRVYTSPNSRSDLRLQARVAEMQDLPVLMARVRRLFDLDADPVAVDTALTTLSTISPLVAAAPGIRVAGCVDPHELLIRTMIDQKISVAAARTVLTRITTELGGPAPAFALGLTHMFPTMESIAERGGAVLLGPKTRRNAVVTAAEALAAGRLRLGFGDDSHEQRKALLALTGVGPWTAEYVRMRVTGDPDVFLIDDGALRAGARRAGLPAGKSELLAWSAQAAPWRSYLTTHLWRAPTVPAQPPEGDPS
ncbi:DNA-3-methyladenine glycosylase 2 family protein [Kocuria sp. cx-116]|uniref:AlkA N-terminal domain-containing protein n=1 Tax=Kocuria sp. cx-116 TaxID=2771378 RepID=UPI001684A107|nr:AlkA N-terminal domain-containing protein [Kocuria sp. cx-116]MBD2763169.1 DNA-3-methyladenine glycosylase 2 family protein [Kocuria sp. cx-116]